MKNIIHIHMAYHRLGELDSFICKAYLARNSEAIIHC